MQFLQTVTIKQILTEVKKANLTQALNQEMKQQQRELEQLQFQQHKAIKDADASNEYQLKKRYQLEMAKRKEALASLAFKHEQLNRLELGTEIADGEAKVLIEYKVGDKWPDQNQPIEMIVRDGRIEEFRESRRSDDGLV